jgi:hypothetical protein
VANEFSRRPGANSDRVSNARDVEKRWHDPPTLRKAVTYDAAAIVLAGIAFAVYATVDRASVVAASSVPAILLLVRHRCVHEGTSGLARRRYVADVAGSGMVPAMGGRRFCLGIESTYPQSKELGHEQPWPRFAAPAA